MAEIFISYRRSDSAQEATRIYESLAATFGASSVFMDRSTLVPGEDYQRKIISDIGSARVLLAVIGRNWTFAMNEDGSLRLDDADDLVRKEVLTAINCGIPVIPVLVAGAGMPNESDLPLALISLARLHALSVTQETFQTDLQRLTEAIIKLGSQEKRLPQAARVSAKVCMVGAAGVGKTSLVRKFVTGSFMDDKYLTTLGVKITKKEIHLGDSHLTILLHDLAGEEQGYEIAPRLLSGASGLIFVTDGRRSSLDTALKLRERFREFETKLNPLPVVLAANKVDIYETWQYRMEELENTGMPTFTTSAKTGKAVEELFEHLARKMMGR